MLCLERAWREARPASATIVLPGGVRVRHVVLGGDDLVIDRDRVTAHLVDRELPVRQLRFARRADGLHAAVQGGVMFVGAGADDDTADSRISPPAEIALFADGPLLAEQALGGTGGAYQLRLRLKTIGQED